MVVYCRRRIFAIFEPDEMKFAVPSIILSLYSRSVQKARLEIPFGTFSGKEISAKFDRSSEYDLKNFQNVFQSL